MGPVLGIESSCDDTAAAVLDEDGRVLAESIASQEGAHAPFGGVVPEIAARAHLALLPDMVGAVMARAGVTFAALGGVAGTAGPGLIGGLIVGTGIAKGIALAAGIPYVGVNHLEAHALTARLPGLIDGGAPFPYLLLLVSGGHCQAVAVEGVGRHVRLGGTVDDAPGEAFDKVAKLLGLGWPGGPALERLAAEGDPRRHAFPRPMLGRPGCDFSFSGLKTAVAREAARHGVGALPRQEAADLAAGFQRAVADVLADRAANAMALFAERFPDAPRLFVVAGGVAANRAIGAALAHAAAAHGFRLAVPPPRLCTDNAVMVAWAGIERLRLGLADTMELEPRPRWPLDGGARPTGT
ncbi:MAG TPA: tRNA (adenosine(37)-N6)-threonylcarbamoyltransferase complex transferase subunit TsaD [Acetobacteraceae bacterium]